MAAKRGQMLDAAGQRPAPAIGRTVKAITAVKLCLRFLFGYVAFVLAFSLAYDTAPWVAAQGATSIMGVIYGLTAVGFAFALRTESSSWRFTSLDDLLASIRASILIGLAFLLIVFAVQRAILLPRSVLALTILIDFAIVAAARVLRRAVNERRDVFSLLSGFKQSDAEVSTLLLIGDLRSADTFLREFDHRHEQTYRVIGIVGGGEGDTGVQVRSVRVIGPTADWPSIVSRVVDSGRDLDAVLFLEDTLAAEHPQVISKLRRRSVRLLRLSRLTELGDNPGGTVREFSVEELLARPAMKLDLTNVRSLIAGKRVLVTGGGGSIGSEICRQVSALSCAHLTILDHSEFALFSVDLQIATAQPGLSRKSILCDVRNEQQVMDWMASERPDIVFHAAALKHVHLVEEHPGEGVMTNVIGTFNVAEAAVTAGAEHMVLISTDKAVAPSNVMGATKRIAEGIIRSYDHAETTRFSAVRFGNVLGSAGSVVPIFIEQIRKGGPITVTHPDVERYFMTIPEAVQLVLHATATSAKQAGSKPTVFVLDMGQPVKIHHLARQMIQLFGKVPDEDIAIEFIGLKPGEKLTEELVDELEVAREPEEGVIEVTEIGGGASISREELIRLKDIAASNDANKIRAAVFAAMHKLRSVPGRTA